MPNGVKYSTTTLTGALKRGNIALGVTGELGPTANTGFYSMPVPASGKYIINKVAASGVPLFFAPQNDTELIQFARNEGATGADTGSAAAVLAWIATQPNLEAANREYENIVTDGLVLNVDAGFVGSYPSTGITWYDLSGNAYSGTLTNGPTFSTNNSGVLIFDGADDNLPISANASQLNLSDSFTIQMCLKPYVVNPTVANVTNKGLFLCANPSGATTNTYLHILIRDQVFMFGFYGNDLYDYSNPLTANTWYIVNFRFNNSTKLRSIWVNGNKNVEQNAGSNLNLANGAVTICGTYNTPFNGELASTLVYNRALTDSEITQNYNALKGRFGL
jgi:hypothetical protein